jgi:DNA (cytosine-5)-methyltransferase 1
MSEPRIREAGYSSLLLPTPTAQLNEPAPWKPGVDWWLQSRATRNLEGVVTGNTPLMPSPVARDWKGVPGKNVQMASLPREISLLPTLASRDWKSCESNVVFDPAERRPLPEVVVNLLPTPNTLDSLPARPAEKVRARNRGNGDHGGSPRNLRESVVHDLLPTPRATDGTRGPEHPDVKASRKHGQSPSLQDRVEKELALLPTPSAGNFNDGEDLASWESRRQRNKTKGINGNGQGTPLGIAVQGLDNHGEPVSRWGKYEPAIRRWEAILGREAPEPTEPGRAGLRLSAKLPEFMMGLPDGWVTDVPDLTRKQTLSVIGNGVCPRQAAMALRMLLQGE